MIQGLDRIQHRCAGHAVAIEVLDHRVVVRKTLQPVFDEGDQHFLVGRAAVGLGKTRIVFQRGPPQGLAHVLPLRLQGEDHQIAARALEYAEGTHHAMMRARAVGWE